MSTQKITDGTLVFDTSAISPPAATTLNGAINNAVTAIVVTSGANVTNGAYLTILAESTNTTETVLVTSGAPTANLTVVRAQLGTAASAHSNAAAVNLPGALTFNLLTIAQAPNVELFLRKTSSDLNYVAITAGSGNTFPGGGTVLLLIDSTSNGTAHIKFPGSGSTLIVLAAGSSAQAGPMGPAGPPGASATPPGLFTIGTITAEWVVTRAS
jgi:hypothetical protein